MAHRVTRCRVLVEGDRVRALGGPAEARRHLARARKPTPVGEASTAGAGFVWVFDVLARTLPPNGGKKPQPPPAAAVRAGCGPRRRGERSRGRRRARDRARWRPAQPRVRRLCRAGPDPGRVSRRVHATFACLRLRARRRVVPRRGRRAHRPGVRRLRAARLKAPARRRRCERGSATCDGPRLKSAGKPRGRRRRGRRSRRTAGRARCRVFCARTGAWSRRWWSRRRSRR